MDCSGDHFAVDNTGQDCLWQMTGFDVEEELPDSHTGGLGDTGDDLTAFEIKLAARGRGPLTYVVHPPNIS